MNSLNNLTKKVFELDTFALLVKNGEIIAAKGVEKHETLTSYMWLINPNNLKLNLAELEKFDNKIKSTFDHKGIWSCIIKDKKDNAIRALTSSHNELPWYYTTGSESIISSNIFLVAKYLNHIDINFEAISSYISFDFCYAGETFIRNIKKTYGGDIIFHNGNNLKVVGYNLVDWLGFDNSITNSKTVLDSFISSVDSSLHDLNTQITLTAGSDSRAILGAAYQTGKDFVLMTGTASSVARTDVIVPEIIAEKLALKHIKIDESKRPIKNLGSALEEVAIRTSSLFMPRNWIIYYKEYLLMQKYVGSISRVMGYRGEFFKGFYSDIDRTIIRKTFFLKDNSKIKLSEFVRNQFEIYKNITATNASELFYHRERDNFWVSSNIRALMQSGCKIYTPFGENELLALGYRFNGGIKKLNLHRHAIDLLPDEIKNIRTSNGRVINILSHIIKRIYKKNNYDYFLSPLYIKENIDLDLLNVIIDKRKLDSILFNYGYRGQYDDLVHKLFAISHFFKILNN